MKRSTEEVIREVEKFLDGAGGVYDWDDFLSIPIHDQGLNAIRIECSGLRDKYPPDNCRQYCGDKGIRRLQEILEELRKK
jgi:hypothetical protein